MKLLLSIGSLALLLGVFAVPTAVFAQEAPAPQALKRRGTTRIEFDPRAVEGQTKKAGAIYLFQRKDAEIKSLVKRRTSFREEILKKLDE